MNYTLETISKQQFAYMRRTGPYGDQNYVLMETFKEWVKKNALFKEETAIYAVSRDNPEIVAPNNCRYDVGIPIDDTFSDYEGVTIGSLFSGGQYAVFQIEHTVEGVKKFWMTFGDILKQEHIRNNPEKPILERYNTKMIDHGYCEMCVPII